MLAKTTAFRYYEHELSHVSAESKFLSVQVRDENNHTHCLAVNPDSIRALNNFFKKVRKAHAVRMDN